MIYTLTVTMTNSDFIHHSLENEFSPEIYLSALAEDIKNLEEVSQVSRDGLIFHIKVHGDLSAGDLKSSMKPLFSGERFNLYRFDTLKACLQSHA